MAEWRVICEQVDPVMGLVQHADLRWPEVLEAAARTEYDLHAGHGRRNIHLCNDADSDPANRWNDRTDPRARYEEGT